MPASTDARSPEELVQLVAENPLFQSVERSHLDDLRDHLAWVSLGANEILFREGDAVDAFYFLIDGRLEVSR